MGGILKTASKFLLLIIFPIVLAGCGSSKPASQNSNFPQSDLTEQSVRSEISDLSSIGTMKNEEIVEVKLIDYGGTEDIPDDKIVFVTYKPKSLWDEKDMVKRSAYTIVAVSERMFKHPKVGFVRVWTQGEFTDQYGQKSTENAVKLGLSRKTAEKIDWGNFKDLVLVDYNKLLDIANEKSIWATIEKTL